MKELDKNVFKILEFLYNANYEANNNIIPILAEIFPITDVNNQQERESKEVVVRRFYNRLIDDKLIVINYGFLGSLGTGNGGQHNWLNDLQPINATIKEKGIELLEADYQRLRNLSNNNQHAKNIDTPIKKLVSQWVSMYSARRTLYDAIMLILAIIAILVGINKWGWG